jgi:hypothetical protein
MRRIFIVLVICLCFISISCYVLREFQPPIAITPEESDYLSKVNTTPLIFRAPKDQAQEVWGRINGWIGKYSSMKIQTASDYVVETYNPTDFASPYGYSASRSPLGNEYEFTIRYSTSNPYYYKKQAELNAHVLAYYALTGEIIERFIGR